MKIFIQNRKQEKIAALIEGEESPKGLAFVMHGLGGFKEQPHLQLMVDALLAARYYVVRFDTTNSFGESDGSYEDATTTNYYEDLEDVIRWASAQSWYQEPFILAGHSLGALCVALYAERNPQKVKALAPISTVVSGKLSLDTPNHRSVAKEWEQTRWRVSPSESKPGVIKRLKWSHIVDRLKYDLLPRVPRLTMPVLLIVGSKDESTPAGHQQILFDALVGPKEMYVIEGSDHNFRTPGALATLKEHFTNWIKKYA